MKINGKFDVKLNSLDFHIKGLDDIGLGRMALDKQFEGELEATSKGEMLSVLTPVKGSAGYVAVEQISGILAGKKGSFVLQHFGIMDRGSQRLILEVVPDSGTGELSGLSGEMTIRFEKNQHYYDFIFTLP
jgi:hypothetical protein